jgi:hypothetical protein
MKNLPDLKNEVAELRKVYDKLIAKKNKMELLIEKREDFHDRKSENWKNSDKGEDYLGTTSEIQDRFYEFDIELEKLDECITEIYEISQHED